MFLKDFVKDYLSFTKKDRVGLLSLIFLIVVIWLLPQFFSRGSKGLTIKDLAEARPAIDTLLNRQEMTAGHDFDKPPAFTFRETENPQIELFRFDPNKLSTDGWRKLGLSEKTSKTIENYRNKGGKFYKPGDLKKIWGLPPGFYDRVKDYIILETSHENASADFRLTAEKMPVVTSHRVVLKKPIDINQADTTAFILLPGIGSKLAARIVGFREKLGGFHSVEQVAETYGLADSVFQKIKHRLEIGNNNVRKLNINTSTKEELKSHPYLKWPLANAIVEYRNQHGNYKILDELKQIKLIDESVYKKIIPYLEL